MTKMYFKCDGITEGSPIRVGLQPSKKILVGFSWCIYNVYISYQVRLPISYYFSLF